MKKALPTEGRLFFRYDDGTTARGPFKAAWLIKGLAEEEKKYLPTARIEGGVSSLSIEWSDGQYTKVWEV